ncbi:MAG: hypothetical protein Q9186_003527 [Xanthomendoza sp. 1 TL-2023]
MRLPPWASIAGALLIAHQSWAHFSLSELQPISGFSDACTQAYDTPLTDCTISDFYEGNPCSPQCYASLEDMTELINDECRGITAFPSTLIGMFFGKKAVQELCSGVEATTASAGDAASSETAEAESTSTSSSSLSMTTSTIVETATTIDTSTVTPISSSTTTSTQISVISSQSTANSGQDSGDGSPTSTTQQGTASASASSSSSSGTQSTPTSANQSGSGAGVGNNDGNGGTVLEAASTGNVVNTHCLLLITMCLALSMFAL